MADFTVNMSGTVEFDDSIVQDYTAEFTIAYNQANVMDQFVQFDRQIGAKSISMPRFSSLAVNTTPLLEREDVTSEAITDTEVLFTPAEYGNVVTLTKLADLQTGGRTGRAAMSLIAQNMASTRNVLAIRALEASGNALFAEGATSNATVDAADVVTAVKLNEIYNKLARASVPTIDGAYVSFMHDDVIADIRALADWQDVAKYAGAVEVLKNEVGMYKGFRIVRNNDCALVADGGATTTDLYTSSFMGFNGLGLAESLVPEIRVTGPFDKLGRMVNVGWYGVMQYGIVEPSAVFTLKSASSLGANV